MAPSLLIAAALAATLPWGAAPVSEVTIEAPGARDTGYLRSVFGIESGEVLSRAAVRRGVQALLATGEIEDVVVTVDDRDGALSLSVRAQVALRDVILTCPAHATHPKPALAISLPQPCLNSSR